MGRQAMRIGPFSMRDFNFNIGVSFGMIISINLVAIGSSHTGDMDLPRCAQLGSGNGFQFPADMARNIPLPIF